MVVLQVLFLGLQVDSVEALLQPFLFVMIYLLRGWSVAIIMMCHYWRIQPTRWKIW